MNATRGLDPVTADAVILDVDRVEKASLITVIRSRRMLRSAKTEAGANECVRNETVGEAGSVIELVIAWQLAQAMRQRRSGKIRGIYERFLPLVREVKSLQLLFHKTDKRNDPMYLDL